MSKDSRNSYKIASPPHQSSLSNAIPSILAPNSNLHHNIYINQFINYTVSSLRADTLFNAITTASEIV